MGRERRAGEREGEREREIERESEREREEREREREREREIVYLFYPWRILFRINFNAKTFFLIFFHITF